MNIKNYDIVVAKSERCCEPVREPSVQSRLTHIKEHLGEASAVLEGTISTLRGGNEKACCGDAPIQISCVMEDLELTVAMAEQVLRLAMEVAAPFRE